MTTLADISTALSAPFPVDDIGLLPKGKTERDGKTLCMAFPYADPRVYEDRLNTLCPGEWSTPPPTALAVGTKLICFVTVIICGIPHTDVGEADPGENQGTEAWSQAFKRAASHFGLGRYLYELEKEWVPFNVQKKQIDLDRAGMSAIVRKMYQKAGIALSRESRTQEPATIATTASLSSSSPAKSALPFVPPGAAASKPVAPAPTPAPTTKPTAPTPYVPSADQLSVIGTLEGAFGPYEYQAFLKQYGIDPALPREQWTEQTYRTLVAAFEAAGQNNSDDPFSAWKKEPILEEQYKELLTKWGATFGKEAVLAFKDTFPAMKGKMIKRELTRGQADELIAALRRAKMGADGKLFVPPEEDQQQAA